MLKTRRFWLGAAFSIVLLGLFFWRVDIRETASALKNANYVWIIPGVAIYFVSVMFRALRWHFLLRPLKHVSPRRLYPVIIVGYMANNLLPVRLGELVRSFFLGHREGVSKSATLATIILERVFDGVGLLIIALVVWPFLPVHDILRDFSDGTGVPVVLLILAVVGPFVVVLTLFFAAGVYPALGRRMVALLVLFVPRALKPSVESVAMKFLDGLTSIRSPKRIIAMMLLTFPIWFAEGTMYWLISFGFEIDQPFHGMMLITSTSNLATSLPSTAGGVGPFEYATRVTLESLDTAAAAAAAFAIVLHVALLAPVTVVGLVVLWMENLSLGELTRRPVSGLVEGYEASSASQAES
ncbi:MAG: lysylphosphatidylglycerol synthase transmembrane domain-containing protein [Dehalococcoidia bacterium]